MLLFSVCAVAGSLIAIQFVHVDDMTFEMLGLSLVLVCTCTCVLVFDVVIGLIL